MEQPHFLQLIVDTVRCVHFTRQGGNENICSNTILFLLSVTAWIFFTWVKPWKFSEKDMRQWVFFCAIVTSDIVKLFLVEHHHIFSRIC